MSIPNNLLRIINSGLIFHPLAVVALIAFLQPINYWYMTKVPLLGIDFFLSVTSVALLQQHFALWINGYKDIWFAGYPLIGDFPRFTYYSMVPFANAFGVIQGIQIYTMFTLLLLLIFCYFLFYKISRNSGLALLLSVLIMLSVNIYGSATWGGSLPYFATQFYLPLVLLAILHYASNGARKWLWLSAMFTGFGFLSHPLPVATFVVPSALILVFTQPILHQKWQLKQRIIDCLCYLTGFGLVAFLLLGPYIISYLLSLSARIHAETTSSLISSAADQVPSALTNTANTAIADFYKNQIQTLFTGTNHYIFFFLVIGLIIYIGYLLRAVTFRKDKSQFAGVISFLLIAIYIGGHAVYNLTGHNFLAQGLYRMFWAFPIAIAALVAATWRPLFLNAHPPEVSSTVSRSPSLFSNLFSVLATLVFVFIAYSIIRVETPNTIAKIEAGSEGSSAFPEALSMKPLPADQSRLKQQLVPSFINPSDKNKRLYQSDATMGIWWNYMFDLPLARGYIDPPIGNVDRGGSFLLDVSIGNDALVKDLKYNEDLAKQYALFLIDWNGIYYFEGGHISPSANAGPSSYLLKGDVFDKKEQVDVKGAILRSSTKSGHPEPMFDLIQSLYYYQFKEELTSPVLYGSNAPAVLVISDNPGYEQIWRVLAAQNINSRYLIPVKGGKFIDKYTASDLTSFDAIILHDYDYHNQGNAYKLLSDYVKNGGKILIDTGGEVKDSNSNNLPELFPIKNSVRDELKTDWNLDISNSLVTKDIKFAEFGPPIFNDHPWKLSHPYKPEDIREGSEVVLKDYGQPILISRKLGAGLVIWSGMNLPYHFQQYSTVAEAKFINNLFQQLVEIKDNGVTKLDVKWESPEKINAIGEKPVKGVLFKEQLYDGWSVKSTDQLLSNLKMYNTGPTHPGFMYVPLKDNQQIPHLQFNFSGMLISWVYALISLAATLLILESALFNGRLFGHRLFLIYQKILKKPLSWWNKDDADQ